MLLSSSMTSFMDGLSSCLKLIIAINSDLSSLSGMLSVSLICMGQIQDVFSLFNISHIILPSGFPFTEIDKDRKFIIVMFTYSIQVGFSLQLYNIQ